MPYDTETSPAVAAAVLAGLVAHPDRAALVATLDPLTGQQRDQITEATRRARARAEALSPSVDGNYWFAEGRERIIEALERTRSGEQLTADEIAWLGVLLTAIFVRDTAMGLLARYDDKTHVALWTTMTRAVDPPYAAAPAALLAFTLSRTGDGPLGRVAVSRSLAADPSYSLALLIRTALAAGVAPDAIRGMDLAEAAGEMAGRVAANPSVVRLQLPETR
jgi:hypothetical protein